MLERKKGSRITDEFLEAFGKVYHAFKYFEIMPVDISKIFCKILDVSKTTYLHYLKLARQKGFVTDTYEENIGKARDRQKGKEIVVDPEVKKLIFSYLEDKPNKKRSPKKTK